MKGGINFEEWKEIVKKNRRSLRSKSNIFRFEPESLTYGAEKAVKSPEYGQVHTITYNVTGMDIPSDWPTEIKSGKTLVLDGITVPYGATATVSASVPYTYKNGVLTIPNIQNTPNITINIGDVLYQNANVGDYLYNDWSFGPTEKDGYLGRCVKKASTSSQNTLWATTSDSVMAWSTESVVTGVADINTTECGQLNTNILMQLGGDKYPAAAWAILQFDGNGYLPSAKQLYTYASTLRNLDMSRNGGLWSSSERNDEKRRYALCIQKGAIILGASMKTLVAQKSIAFIDLLGSIGKPINNNGHEYVDLGLPSGTLWATMNVGANSVTDYGNYYMYGKGAAQYNSSDTVYDGMEDPLDLSVDTAKQVWGGAWHMPTKTQMEELVANTTYQWVTDYNGSGINGGLFTATNGAVLFFPATGRWYSGSQSSVGSDGYYWGSSPVGSNTAFQLNVFNVTKIVNTDYREYGHSVRPVIG